MKIGAITIGQAPRTDVTADILDIFGDTIELFQKGGLDGLTREEIETFVPEERDYVLVSRLTDGTSVTFAERYILGNLQKGIDALEAEGVRLIMVFCTGEFPASLTSHVPMIFPNDLLHKIVPMLTRTGHIIAITPSPLQVAQNNVKWQGYVDKCTSIAASPYGNWETLEKAAEQARDLDGDIIVLDCIGFTRKMKKMFAERSGKLVVLPRTLLARVVSEVTDLRD
ncbi:MAG: AroM family protein [Lachnospiraceae bacterium]|nr:AroM family protein [Lachnospiraceae bacterium]